MSEYWIKYLDPVESLMSISLAKLIKPELSYKAFYYKEGIRNKIKKEYEKDTFIGFNKEGYFFYSGFIPRVRTFCQKKKIVLDEYDIESYGITYKTPILPSHVDPRTFQISMVQKVIELERGVLKASTGVGKTVLGMYVISCLDGLGNVLWLCHTKDLMHQAADEAEKWFGKHSVGRVGDGHLTLGKFFTSATRQTFKDHAKEWGTEYDMVILDEVQHLSELPEIKKGKEIGEYGHIFKRILAPIRIGLTATYPDSIKAKFAIEGLVGPLLEEFSIKEATDQGYMAHPIIRIKKISKSDYVKSLRKYPDVYEWGVVRRLERNRIIIDIVEGHHKKNESALIVVNKVDHGKLIENLGLKRNLKIKFVYGKTDTDTRDLIKRLLNSKQIDCAICTNVWKEGTNIPELDAVINAGGGKSELGTLQIIGRGMRKTAAKSVLYIYDFFDPSHYYLIDHFGHRFSLYCDNGWIN